MLIGAYTARFAEELFSRGGRPSQKALYGLTNLARTYERANIDAACERLIAAQCFSYAAVNGEIVIASRGTACGGYTILVERGSLNSTGPSDRRAALSSYEGA